MLLRFLPQFLVFNFILHYAAAPALGAEVATYTGTYATKTGRLAVLHTPGKKMLRFFAKQDGGGIHMIMLPTDLDSTSER